MQETGYRPANKLLILNKDHYLNSLCSGAHGSIILLLLKNTINLNNAHVPTVVFMHQYPDMTAAESLEELLNKINI